MMSNKLLVERLDELAHLEIDAVLASGKALAAGREPHARVLVEAFERDREAHLEALNHLLFNHGGKTAPLAADPRGHVLEGVAVTLGFAGTGATLLAMVATASVLASGYRGGAAGAVPRRRALGGRQGPRHGASPAGRPESRSARALAALRPWHRRVRTSALRFRHDPCVGSLRDHAGSPYEIPRAPIPP